MCELSSDELPMLSYLSREARSLFPYDVVDLKDEAWEAGQDAPPAPLAAATQTLTEHDQLNPQLSFAFLYKAVGSSLLCGSQSQCVENRLSKQTISFMVPKICFNFPKSKAVFLTLAF